MQMTIGQAFDKVDAMRLIIREIESGGSVDERLDDIVKYLNEYMYVIENVKVNI